MKLTVIVALPAATPVTVTKLLVFAAISLPLACATVAIPVALELTVNFPFTFELSLNVIVPPATTVPLVALRVITGVAFFILHVNSLSANVPSLHI